MPEPFVAALIERQERDCLSDQQFAEQLGVDRSYWFRVRRGDRRAARRLINGALRLDPSLAPLLADPLTIGTDTVAERDHTP